MTTTFVLVPGAGGDTWFWHRLVAELEGRGHRAVPVELPAADESAGLAAYADTVVAAIGDHSPVVLVAQSMGGLTAPLVCGRVPVDLLVLVNAMVPRAGETGGEWWTVTGQSEAAAGYRQELGLPAELDDDGTYFHDVPAEVAAAAKEQEFAQSGRPFEDPVAAGALAGRPHPARGREGGPALPRGVPAADRGRAAGTRRRRGAGRPPARTEPAGRVGRPAGGLPQVDVGDPGDRAATNTSRPPADSACRARRRRGLRGPTRDQACSTAAGTTRRITRPGRVHANSTPAAMPHGDADGERSACLQHDPPPITRTSSPPSRAM